MKWNIKLISTKNIFIGSESIISTDLSNLNSSSIGYMIGMLGNYTSLEFVKMANFNTIKSIIFFKTFEGCISLIYYKYTNT